MELYIIGTGKITDQYFLAVSASIILAYVFYRLAFIIIPYIRLEIIQKIITKWKEINSHKENKGKPYETAFVIAVAVAAILATTAGVLSVRYNSGSQLYLNLATMSLEQEMEDIDDAIKLEEAYLNEQKNKLDLAYITEINGEIETARTMRNETVYVIEGYLTYNGEPTQNYTSYEEAIIQCDIDHEYEIVWEFSYYYGDNGEIIEKDRFSQSFFYSFNLFIWKTQSYVTASLIFSIAILMGSVGMSADSLFLRKVCLAIIVLFIVLASIYMLWIERDVLSNIVFQLDSNSTYLFFGLLGLLNLKIIFFLVPKS
ncbi:MAG: hypothetical protein R6W91_07010 [Thermoplasmata archaeon]